MKKHENKFHILNDDDVGKLFALKPKTKRTLWHFVWYVLIFIAIFTIVFVIANFSSLTKQMNYWYEDNYGTNKIDPKQYEKLQVAKKKFQSNGITKDYKMPETFN